MNSFDKDYIDLLHLLTCQKAHETDMMKILNRSNSKCYYYLESDVADGDQLPDHLEWIEIADNFRIALGFETSKECLDFIRATVNISQEVRKLVYGNKTRLDFLLSII